MDIGGRVASGTATEMMYRKYKCRVSMDSVSGKRRDTYKDVSGRKRLERVFEQVFETRME